MARKRLEDFDYDYQAYANYLESAECANDEGYDIIADQYGNVYTPTEGDWTKGHGHKNKNTGYDRPSERKDSYGRKWKNPWLKYDFNVCFTENEINFIKNFQKENCNLVTAKKKTLKKI